MFEIRIQPETEADFAAVQEILEIWASSRNTDAPNKRVSVDIDIPYPPNGSAESTSELRPDAVAQISRDQVTEALQAYARANGAVALKAVLDQVGVRRASDLAPEHFAAVMAAIAQGDTA